MHRERYVDVELRGSGSIHLADTAFADLAGDAVGAEGGAGVQGHQCVSIEPGYCALVITNSDR